MANTLKRDLIRYRRLKAECRDLDARLTKRRAEADRLQAKIFSDMENAEIESIKASGNNFVRMQTAYASMQDRDAFVTWAKENDSTLIKEAESRRDLNALVRERLDNGEELPPGVGFYTRDVVSIRAA